MTNVSAKLIEDALRALIVAKPNYLGTAVTVPVVYADGEIASVIVAGADREYLVHDGGEGSQRVSAAGFALTEAVTSRLATLARRFRCAFVEGRVVGRADAEQLAAVACLVANASRAVADFIWEGQREEDIGFRHVILARLREALGARVRENGALHGRSGTNYIVPAVVLDPSLRYPVHIVAMLSSRDLLGNVFTMFHDIGAALPDVPRSAIFEESGDLTPNDRNLLRQVGAVVGLIETPLMFRKMANAPRAVADRFAIRAAGE